MGSVTDPNGGLVPGAQVVLTHDETQTVTQQKTDAAGYFAFTSLQTGHYTLVVTAPGFKGYRQSGILLNAGMEGRIDVKLSLGTVSEQVTVTGEAPVIETRDATLNDIVDKQALDQLPNAVNGGKRDITAFEQAIPGFQGGSGFQTVYNGSIGLYGEMLVDGAPAECNPAALGGCLRGEYSQEAVSEFKVADATDAASGFSSGAEVSMVSKSGTNALHGAGYEYIRNNDLDSRCATCFGANPQVPKNQQNEFGFDVGGPVYIPKVYDGRNKTFFFANFSWFRYLYSAAGSVYTMPIDAYKQGDFSSLLGSQIGTDALGRPVLSGEIYNPATQRTVTAGQLDPTSGLTAVASGVYRDPFTNNMIPNSGNSAWSPVSQKFQSFYPESNPALGSSNNYNAAGGSGASPDRTWSLKVDQYIGTKYRISGFYWNDSNVSTSPWALPDIFAVRNYSYGDSHPSHVSFTMTLSPTTVNDMIGAQDRVYSYTTSSFSAANNGAALIGQPNALGPCLPAVHIGSIFAGTQTELKCGQGEGDTNWRFVDNLTHQTGKHILKFGGNWIKWAGNFPVVTNATFTFLPAETSLPGAFTSQTGFAYSSFLLGDVDNASAQGGQYQAGRDFEIGIYAQDEYHITPRLTLNLGLRYDVQPFPDQTGDRVSQWNATLPNPGAGGIPGAETFAGFGTGRLGIRRLQPTLYGFRDFGPRIGFAYRLKDKTVIRGNWGIYEGPVVQQMAGFDAVIQQGFFPLFTAASSDGYTAPFNWSGGYPLPSGNLFGNFVPTVANGSSTYYFGEDASRPPRIYMYHLSIQHQLPGKILMDVAYFGQNSHGIIADGPQERNQITDNNWTLGNLLTEDAYSTDAVNAGIKIPYVGFTGNVAQALRPFPQYLSIQNEGAAVSWATYNSAQIKFQRQWSNGFSFLIGYTISKQLSDIGTQTPGYFAAAYQDAYNSHAEKAIPGGDIPQQIIANYVYELPVGPGKKFLNSNNIVDKYILGGWQISGIHTYQSGNPVGVSTEGILPTMSTGALNSDFLRPDLTGASLKEGPCKLSSQYLNPAGFRDPAPWTFGNASRQLPNVRSCHYLNENFSLNKFFPITEHAKFNVGVDTFNLFNRTQPGGPNTDVDAASGFGTINGSGSGRIVQLHGRIDF